MSKERQGGQDSNNQSRPSQPEQLSDGNGSEAQPRPSVWDVLERQVKLWVPGRPRMNKKEFIREAREVKLLKEEIQENGTVRERLTFTLYDLEKMLMRPDRPGRDILKLLGISPRNVLLEEIHSLRSRVEAMSDEQLVDRVRWLEKLKRAPTENEPYRH